MVLRFTDNTYEELKRSSKPGNRWLRSGSSAARSQMATRKDMHYNLDARILQDVLSPEPGGLFVAFVHGKHYDGKTLFIIDPHGVPDVSPEEVRWMTYGEDRSRYMGLVSSRAPNTLPAWPAVRKRMESSSLTISNSIPRIEKSGRLDGKATIAFTCSDARSQSQCRFSCSELYEYRRSPGRAGRRLTSCKKTRWRTRSSGLSFRRC